MTATAEDETIGHQAAEDALIHTDITPELQLTLGRALFNAPHPPFVGGDRLWQMDLTENKGPSRVEL